MEIVSHQLLLAGGAFGYLGSPEILTWLIPASAFLVGLAMPLRRWTGLASEEHDDPSSGAALPTYKRKYPDFCRELDRVRRYDRSLAVLVMKLDEEQVEEIREGLLKQIGAAEPARRTERILTGAFHAMFANVGFLAEDLLRDMDTATCDLRKKRFVLLLPEVATDEALGTARRLSEAILEVAGVRVRTGVAEFRTDGVLIEDLVEVASERCDRSEAGPSGAVTLNPSRGRPRLQVKG